MRRICDAAVRRAADFGPARALWLSRTRCGLRPSYPHRYLHQGTPAADRRARRSALRHFMIIRPPVVVVLRAMIWFCSRMHHVPPGHGSPYRQRSRVSTDHLATRRLPHLQSPECRDSSLYSLPARAATPRMTSTISCSRKRDTGLHTSIRPSVARPGTKSSWVLLT